MALQGKAPVTIGLVAVLLVLGIADAVLTGDRVFSSVAEDPAEERREPVEISIASSTASESAQSSSVAGTKKGQRRVQAPDVEQTIAQLGFEMQDTNELMLMRTVISQEEATVHSAVLLKDGDRAGVIAWTESPKVKIYFLGLKEALHVSFSSAITDLIDETQRPQGRPVRNMLSFFDPGISEERLVFVRVRDRLYEVHSASGADEVVFELIEALSR